MKRQAADLAQDAWRSEHLLRALMDASPYIIHFKDLEGRYTDVNRAFENLIGLPREKILGRTIRELPRILDPLVSDIVELDRKVLRTGKPVEYRAPPPIERERDTMTRVVKFPVFGPRGNVEGVGTLIADITEQERTEEELRETSRRAELAQRQAKIGYWRWSFEDDCLSYWSKEAGDILRYPTAGAPENYEEMVAPVHPEDRPRVLAVYQAADEGPEDYAVEFRVVHDDGQITHVLEVGEVEHDENSMAVAHVGFIQDVTALKTAEATASRLLAAIDNLTQSVALYDHEDRLVFGNMVFWVHNSAIAGIVKPGDTYERQLEVMIEKGCFPEAVGQEEAWMKRRLEQHSNPAEPVEIVREDGLVLQLLETRLPDGGIAILATDVSGYKRFATALSAAKEEAEVANRAKTEFLANMSHELRTPLNSIIGFSQVILSETFGPLGNERYKEYANDIYGSGRHLLALISDILDISKIETRDQEIDAEKLNLNNIIRECRKMVRERVESARLVMSSDVQRGLPALLADRRHIMQILLNLLVNAIKFTPEGGQIMIRARRNSDGAILMEVTDTGIGIPAEDLPKITLPFYQVGNRNAMHSKPGTGLGLALVKSLAELHGGSFTIRSKKDLGTRATVMFPPERAVSE